MSDEIDPNDTSAARESVAFDAGELVQTLMRQLMYHQEEMETADISFTPVPLSSDPRVVDVTTTAVDDEQNEAERYFRITVEEIDYAGRPVSDSTDRPAGQYAAFAPLAEFMANTRPANSEG